MVTTNVTKRILCVFVAKFAIQTLFSKTLNNCFVQ